MISTSPSYHLLQSTDMCKNLVVVARDDLFEHQHLRLSGCDRLTSMESKHISAKIVETLAAVSMDFILSLAYLIADSLYETNSGTLRFRRSCSVKVVSNEPPLNSPSLAVRSAAETARMA